VAAVALAVALPAAGAVPRGDPAARLPEGASASETWDLFARLDTGDTLFAMVTLVNTGWGGRTAIALGQLVEADGTSHPFSRTERPGGYRLEAGGRRIDLHSVVLDLSQQPWRFVVAKNELEIRLAVHSIGAPAWPSGAERSHCPLDLLAPTGRASASWRLPLEDRGRPAAAGAAGLTHRWMPGLEVGCLQRGLEVFAMDGARGLYYREVTAADGTIRPWLVFDEDGRRVFAGVPFRHEIGWRAAAPGYPEAAWLRFEAPGVAGRVDFPAPLGVFEPLGRLPGPLRWMFGLASRPRLEWSAPRFEIRTGDADPGETWSGVGVAKLSYTNPASGDDRPAAPADGGS
jgi:hypothetical protein